jgi:hypothetical protein
MERKGYKVTGPDMKCRNFQFELNKTYIHDGNIELCRSGFHFCLIANDCFNYYSFDSSNRVFEITFGDNVFHGEDKSVTNTITLIRELSWDEVLKLVNLGNNNTGRANSGNWNSGDSNSGNGNSGRANSGNWNSGNDNSGHRNSGNSNSGNWNSGNDNSGNWNSGNDNSGNWNSGNRNSGNSNSGNWNTGNRNTGNRNTGNRNSGDSNSGYRNSGAFCTNNNPYMIIFDKPTSILTRDWEVSKVMELMSYIKTGIWVPFNDMTPEEKLAFPDAEKTDGYYKTITLHEAWAIFWKDLKDKDLFLNLPNFDADKFKEITGIQV